MTQTLILTGSLHWLIQGAHLLVGIGAMALVMRIEKRYQRLKLVGSGGTSPEWGRVTPRVGMVTRSGEQTAAGVNTGRP